MMWISINGTAHSHKLMGIINFKIGWSCLSGFQTVNENTGGDDYKNEHIWSKYLTCFIRNKRESTFVTKRKYIKVYFAQKNVTWVYFYSIRCYIYNYSWKRKTKGSPICSFYFHFFITQVKITWEAASHWIMVLSSGSPPKAPQPQFPVTIPILLSSWPRLSQPFSS